MFSFRILSGLEYDDEGQAFWRGEVRLGAFAEEFLAAAALWDAAAYEAQWRAAARQLVNGGYRTGFLTSYHGPNTPWHVWWPAWREGCEVYLHNSLRVAEALPGPFEPARIAELVDVRSSRTEDGLEISEWRVHIRDIAAFLGEAAPAPRSA